jgi:hypothetical protein
MPGPGRAGLFIYAVDSARIASFYEAVAGMTRLHETHELIVLESPDIQLLVHAILLHIAASTAITSPPHRREESALKFFFTVPSLARARRIATQLGGEVFSEH